MSTSFSMTLCDAHAVAIQPQWTPNLANTVYVDIFQHDAVRCPRRRYSNLRGLQPLQVHIDVLQHDALWHPSLLGPHAVSIDFGHAVGVSVGVVVGTAARARRLVFAPVVLGQGLLQVVALGPNLRCPSRVLAVQVQRHLLLVIARLRGHGVQVHRVVVKGIVRLLTVGRNG